MASKEGTGGGDIVQLPGNGTSLERRFSDASTVSTASFVVINESDVDSNGTFNNNLTPDQSPGHSPDLFRGPDDKAVVHDSLNLSLKEADVDNSGSVTRPDQRSDLYSETKQFFNIEPLKSDFPKTDLHSHAKKVSDQESSSTESSIDDNCLFGTGYPIDKSHLPSDAGLSRSQGSMNEESLNKSDEKTGLSTDEQVSVTDHIEDKQSVSGTCSVLSQGFETTESLTGGTRYPVIMEINIPSPSKQTPTSSESTEHGDLKKLEYPEENPVTAMTGGDVTSLSPGRRSRKDHVPDAQGETPRQGTGRQLNEAKQQIKNGNGQDLKNSKSIGISSSAEQSLPAVQQYSKSRQKIMDTKNVEMNPRTVEQSPPIMLPTLSHGNSNPPRSPLLELTEVVEQTSKTKEGEGNPSRILPDRKRESDRKCDEPGRKQRRDEIKLEVEPTGVHGACGGPTQRSIVGEPTAIEIRGTGDPQVLKGRLSLIFRHKLGNQITELKRDLNEEDQICFSLVFAYSYMYRKLDEEIRNIGGRMVDTGKTIYMECIDFSSGKKDFKQFMQNCQSIIDKTLHRFVVEKLKIQNELQKELNAKAIKEIPEVSRHEAWLFSTQTHFWVVSSEKIMAKIRPTLKTMEESLGSLNKEPLSCTIELMVNELCLFKEEDFFSFLKNRIPEITFKIQDQPPTITIKGRDEEVQNVQKLIESKLSTLVTGHINYPTSGVQLLKTGEMKKYIDDSLRSNRICCVWEPLLDKSVVEVHAYGSEMLDASVEHIQSSVVWNTAIQSNVVMKEIRQPTQWQTELASLHIKHKWKFVIDMKDDTFTVTGLPDVVEDCLGRWNKIAQMLSSGTKSSCAKTLVMEREVFVFLSKCHQNELQELTDQRNVTIQELEKTDKAGFMLKGEEKDVQQAEDYIKDVASGIKTRRHHIDDDGYCDPVRFFASTKGKVLVTDTEVACKCCIKVETYTEKKTAKNPEERLQDKQEADPDYNQTRWTFRGSRKKSIAVQMSHCADTDADVHVKTFSAGSRSGTQQGIDPQISWWKGADGQKFVGFWCPVWNDGKNKEKDQMIRICDKVLREGSESGFTCLAISVSDAEKYSWKVRNFTKCWLVPVIYFLKADDTSDMRIIFCAADETVYRTLVGVVGESLEGSKDKIEFHQFKCRHRSGDSAKDGNQLKISVIKGELANQSADCLVNTINPDLELDRGAVSNSLLIAAGMELQKECTQRYPKGIKLGDIAVTAGYKLKCKHVFHGALDAWNSYQGKTLLKTMNKFIKSCLNEASQRGLTSIAFPALGSGNLRYPVKVVAEEMYRAVYEFQKENKHSSLTSVLFVIYPKNTETFKAFEVEDRRFQLSHAARPKPPGQAKRIDTSPTPGVRQTFSVGGTTIVVEDGDVTRATEDAIVLLWNEKNMKKGHLVFDRAGDVAKRDWEYKRDKKYLEKYDEAITLSGSLPCSKIINVYVKKDSIKKAVEKALTQAGKFGHRISLAFSLLNDDPFQPDEWASSVYDAIRDMKYSTISNIRLVIPGKENLSAVISTLCQKTGTVLQKYEQAAPTTASSRPLVTTDTVKCCFLITGPDRAIQRAIEYLDRGFRTAREKTPQKTKDDLHTLDSPHDNEFSSMPSILSSQSTREKGSRTWDTKLALKKSLSSENQKSVSRAADVPARMNSLSEDKQLGAMKNGTASAQNQVLQVQPPQKPVLVRTDQEECCVLLSNPQTLKKDENRLTTKIVECAQNNGKVVKPFIRDDETLFIFPSHQDAEQFTKESQKEGYNVSQLEPQIVVNVKEDINPGLLKEARARNEWNDLKKSIQSKSGITIVDSPDGNPVTMEGSKLQIEVAEDTIACYAKTLGVPVPKCSVNVRLHRKNEDLVNPLDVCEIKHVSPSMYDTFIDLFSDTLRDFKTNNVKLKYLKHEHTLLIIAPESEISAAENSVTSKLKGQTNFTTEDVQILGEETEKVQDVLSGLVDMQDDVHYEYDAVKKIVTITGKEYEAVHKVKHRILLGVGRIKETGRRNRKFEETPADDKKFDLPAPTGMKVPAKKVLDRKSPFPPSGCKKYIINKELTVYVYCDNILELPVDCIVNAANENLQHGGGVAWVIAKAAGPDFDKESLDYVHDHGNLFVGTSCATGAGCLHYKCVIHTVGPRWDDYDYYNKKKCLDDLHMACVSSLLEAEKQKMMSIAFPAISAGVFGVPKNMCAEQYAEAVFTFSKTTDVNTHVREIHFMDKDFGIVWDIRDAFNRKFDNAAAAQSIQHDAGQTGASGYGSGGGTQTSNSGHRMMTRSKSNEPQDSYAGVVKQKSYPTTDVSNTRNTDESSLTTNQKKYLQIVANQPDIKYPKCEQTTTKDGQLYSIFRLQENFDVHVYRGDILESNVAAIVCSESMDKQKQGVLSKKLSEKGGKAYLKAKEDQWTYANKSMAEVFISKAGGKLKCNRVIHVFVPFWSPDVKRQFLDKISLCFKNVLKSTETHPVTTIAMPLLGAGREGSPIEACISAFINEVLAFSENLSKLPHLREIHIIDQNDGVIAVVANELSDHVRAERDRLNSDFIKREMNKNSLSEKDIPLNTPSEMNKNSLSKKDIPPNTPSLEQNNPEKVKESNSLNIKPGETANKKASGTSDKQMCAICTEEMTNPVKLKECQHKFCQECIDTWFKQKPTCPSCGIVYGELKGDQPDGKMDTGTSSFCLPGETCNTLVITYHFPDGIQKENHPNPGKHFTGTTRRAYLPDNTEGRKVLELLKIAFKRKLIFTIGNSRTTGQNDVVTWNDIHHKTSVDPGPFSYPDSTYLQRVQEELAAKGVTEKDLKKV